MVLLPAIVEISLISRWIGFDQNILGILWIISKLELGLEIGCRLKMLPFPTTIPNRKNG